MHEPPMQADIQKHNLYNSGKGQDVPQRVMSIDHFLQSSINYTTWDVCVFIYY